MKTSGFLIVVCLLMSLTLSAQTTFFGSKPDSSKLKIDTNSNIFKFDKTPQNYSPNNKSFNLNQNLSMTDHTRNFVDPNFRMPVKKPAFQSNMPIMKPDSTVHFHLLIKKIR